MSLKTNPRKPILILTFVGTMLALYGCKEESKPVDDLARANAPAHSPAAQARQPAAHQAAIASSGKLHEGTIQEVIDVTNYTYIRFTDQQGMDHWAAVLKGKFEVEQEVAIVESLVQKNFTSPTLNRTFESIIFGNIVNDKTPSAAVSPQNVQLPEGHPAVDSGSQLPQNHPPIGTDAPE